MLAIIGGTGLNNIAGFALEQTLSSETPFGEAVIIRRGKLRDCKQSILFSPRHGDGHTLPPHLINYRANIWALKQAGATQVLGINAVGGIRQDLGPGRLFLPDQIIDYSYGREHTFFTGDAAGVDHIDFTEPYDPRLREQVIAAAKVAGTDLIVGGVYACTQGPRLETAAEIRKLRADGCDVVGMTGMPEAALAWEAGLAYAAINLVVNWAAGLSEQIITMEAIHAELVRGMEKLLAVFTALADRQTPSV